MSEEPNIDPRHSSTRAALRMIGPLVAVIGLVFTVIGFASFFSAFGTFEPPHYFWCAFIGLPLLAIGVGVTQFAFFGSIARYFLGETAPVVKDTFNYLAEGTKGGVKTTAQAIGEGLATGMAPGPKTTICARCKQANDADARFCKGCGAALVAGG